MKRLFLVLVCFALSGCAIQQHYAPVVNGWQQPEGQRSLYRVQKGDTIYSIAWAYGYDYRTLAQANHIAPPYTIHVGQTLRLVPSEEVAPEVRPTQVARLTTPTKTPARKTTPAKPKPVPASARIRVWQWPSNGRVVDRFSPKLGGNMGIDIAGRYGEPIHAAASGTVVYTGSGLRSYGRLIIIKHNAVYLSAYAHNKSLLVKEGQHVKAGQKIAEMGRTDAGKVQLHFEIRRSGKPVDPLRYLPTTPANVPDLSSNNHALGRRQPT